LSGVGTFYQWLLTTTPFAVDTLVETLYTFPLDVTLIADVIYTHSKVMDGRHFAEEFIRRKKLADKGIFDKSSTGAEGEDDDGGDGWNEVVKRGGGGGSSTAQQQQQQGDAGMLGAGFKVVPSRKKGRK
jgi:PERQ amino acid-rich with GYF domain-containing protein